MKIIVPLWIVLLLLFFNLPYTALDFIVCMLGYITSIVGLFIASFWVSIIISERLRDD